MQVELISLIKIGALAANIVSYGVYDLNLCSKLADKIAESAEQRLSLNMLAIPGTLKTATAWIGCLKTTKDVERSLEKVPNEVDPDKLNWEYFKRVEINLKANNDRGPQSYFRFGLGLITTKIPS